jgi:hypothetical protein
MRRPLRSSSSSPFVPARDMLAKPASRRGPCRSLPTRRIATTSDVALSPDGTLVACGVVSPDENDLGNAWIRKLAR